MAERGGETSRGGPPLTVLLEELGQSAYMLEMDLTPTDEPMPFAPGESPRWIDSDSQAFGGLIDLLRSADFIEDKLGQEAAERLPKLKRLYDVLPFTDEERRDIRNWHKHGWYTTADEYCEAAELVAEREGRQWVAIDFRIILAGDRLGVDKRDFVRRWAAWRRGADEYTDGSAFEQTMEALLDIGHELRPEGPDLGERDNPLRANF